MFQPIVPSDGLTGWRFLQRTYDAQLTAFNASAVVQRDTDYFSEKIGEVETAEDLVKDRRLLGIALGAFGLQDDIENRFFIQKVLEEGTGSSDALAMRLSDTRYREMSDAFGFGPGALSLRKISTFAPEMIDKFQSNSFEIAAGNQNEAMRVALFAQRELPALASDTVSNDAKWFSVMGNPPMRELFEGALNLPSSIGQIDIDQQLDVFKERALSVFGTDDLSEFVDDEKVQSAIDRYVVRDQINTFSAQFSSGSIALTLLQGG
jgi:hypothetical protein